MPEVSIKVGPKIYQVRCGEGEQDRISALGDMIAEKYAQLGPARAPQDSDKLLFTARFLADDLSETRKRESEAYKAAKDARTALETAVTKVEHEKSRSGGKKAELRAEIETLQKAEKRARDEVKALKEEITQLREANEHQHDLFGSPVDEEAIAVALEKLADKAEAAASAMESAAQPTSA